MMSKIYKTNSESNLNFTFKKDELAQFKCAEEQTMKSGKSQDTHDSELTSSMIKISIDKAEAYSSNYLSPRTEDNSRRSNSRKKSRYSAQN